jgi:hypothetical protein
MTISEPRAISIRIPERSVEAIKSTVVPFDALGTFFSVTLISSQPGDAKPRQLQCWSKQESKYAIRALRGETC